MKNIVNKLENKRNRLIRNYDMLGYDCYGSSAESNISKMNKIEKQLRNVSVLISLLNIIGIKSPKQ